MSFPGPDLLSENVARICFLPCAPAFRGSVMSEDMCRNCVFTVDFEDSIYVVYAGDSSRLL